MDFLTPLEWAELVFSILGIVGVFLVSVKKKSGFIWIGLGQFLFVFYFYHLDQVFLAVQNIILFLFNVYGYYYWTLKEKINE